MNEFYHQAKFLQWFIAILMLVLLLAIFGYWLKLTLINPIFYLLIFVFTPIGQFLMTPFFTLVGVYKYLSPMLLVFGASAKKYDLHNGTSFDYLFVMRKYKPGMNLRQKNLEFYLDGMLKVIDKIENKKLSENVIVRGSSYFFSDRTAERLGFKLSKTNLGEQFNLIINYLDLIWMYSIAHGKLVFPNLKNVKTAEIKGTNLLINKSKFEELYIFLKQKNNTSN